MGDFTIGLQLLLIGFGSVIVSLILLSFFLQASGKFLGPESKKKDKKVENASNQSEVSNSEKLNEVEEDNSSNGKKIAAISAAVYQYLDSDKDYKIISIRKADSSWKR